MKVKSITITATRIQSIICVGGNNAGAMEVMYSILGESDLDENKLKGVFKKLGENVY